MEKLVRSALWLLRALVPSCPRALRSGRTHLAIVAAALLAACATTAPRTSAPPALSLRLPPATLGASVSLQQRLTVSHDGRSQSADALLEIDDQALQLVLLVGPRRMLTLRWDGSELQQQRDPKLPQALQGERFIDDIQLAYWPAAALRTALPAGWSVRETERQRTLAHDGETMMQIDYSGDTRWLGRIVIDHLGQAYRLNIESVAAQ